VSGLRGALTFRKILIVAQVALSLLLLEGAGLFVKTLSNLKAVDLGYDRENILLVELIPAFNGSSDAQSSRFFTQVVERVGQLPGVRSASLGSMGIMGPGMTREGIDVEGYTRRGDEKAVWINSISPKYFETLGISVLLGRSFTERDDKSSPKVAIVNRTLARRYFGDADPLGVALGSGHEGHHGGWRCIRWQIQGRSRSRTWSICLCAEPRYDDTAGAHCWRSGKMTAAIGARCAQSTPTCRFTTSGHSKRNWMNHFPERLVATLSSWFGGFAILLARLVFMACWLIALPAN
jgi:hypothetical protein